MWNMSSLGSAAYSRLGAVVMQVEKIHDVKRHVSNGDALHGPKQPPRVAVINLKVTRLIAFVIVSLSLLTASVVCVAAIWNYVETDYAWRALGSLGVVSAAAAIFVSLNEGFGPFVRG